MSLMRYWRSSVVCRNYCLFVLVVAMSLSAGCIKKVVVEAPPCPQPGEMTAEELTDIYRSDLETTQLHEWLSRISRFCDALSDA